jgi:hypothetical protein
MNFTMVVKRKKKQKPSWWKIKKVDEATDASATAETELQQTLLEYRVIAHIKG